MNAIDIIHFILIIGVLQGFGFNIFTVLITRRKVSQAVIYLNLTVLFLSLNNLQAWYLENYEPDNFFLKEMLIPWDLGIVPLFHAFLVYYLRIEDIVKRYVLTGAMIFVTDILLRIILISYLFYFVPDYDNSILKKFTLFEEIFIVCFNLYVFFNCYRLLFRKQKLYPFILKFDNVSWLQAFMKFGMLMFLLWIIAIIVFTTAGNIIGYQILRLGLSILIYWMAYEGFGRYHKINDQIFLRKSLALNNSLKISPVKTNDSISSDEKHRKDFEMIDSYIIERQRYLDANLSLEELAQELNMSSSHLSKIINTYSDYNFSDYINSLRIQQAKKFLNDDSYRKYTIVAIGLECGFNSKSTFYSSFKKFTSLTPSEYRKKES